MNVLPSTCIKGFKDKVRDVRPGRGDSAQPTCMKIMRDSIIIGDVSGKISMYEVDPLPSDPLSSRCGACQVTKARQEEVFHSDRRPRHAHAQAPSGL